MNLTRLRSGTTYSKLNRLEISHVLKGVDHFKLVDVAKDFGLRKQIIQQKNSIKFMKNHVHTNS